MPYRMGAPCPQCHARFLHEHFRLRGGPMDGQVKAMPLQEKPPPVAVFNCGLLADGEVVYPAPMPGGPFEKVRYRLVVVYYRLLMTNYDPGGADSVVESWPHRDDDGMLVYGYDRTVPYGE